MDEDAQRSTQPGEEGDKLSPGEVAYPKERRKAKSKKPHRRKCLAKNRGYAHSLIPELDS